MPFKNREEGNKRRRLLYNTDPKVRAGRDRDNVNYYRRLRDKVIDFLGGRCSNPCCAWVNADGSKGCNVKACLQIDHVEGGGRKELKSMAATAYLNKVLKDTEGKYQLLCANCNWIKRLLNGEDNRSRLY